MDPNIVWSSSPVVGNKFRSLSISTSPDPGVKSKEIKSSAADAFCSWRAPRVELPEDDVVVQEMESHAAGQSCDARTSRNQSSMCVSSSSGSSVMSCKVAELFLEDSGSRSMSRAGPPAAGTLL